MGRLWFGRRLGWMRGLFCGGFIRGRGGLFGRWNISKSSRRARRLGRFVGGESHLYLGRKYRLKIARGDADCVSLRRGYFYVDAIDTSPARVAKLLDDWYRRKAETIFQDTLLECWRDFPQGGFDLPVIRIRKMKTRWGSLSAKGAMSLNLLLIQAPTECIHYVITHELCHLFYRGHGRDFYRLLESRIPDWRRVQNELEMTLS